MRYCLRSPEKINRLILGYFPSTWKCALVRPLLKKDGLPPVFKNFRPVSNLAFISKLVETVVAKQLQHYLNCNNLFPVFLSAYRQNHSTETALLKVMNDILLNMNNQCVTMLILFDLSAVFDTVNLDTMLRRLEYSSSIQGKALLVCILFVWTRENELRERIPVPHDNFFKSL